MVLLVFYLKLEFRLPVQQAIISIELSLRVVICVVNEHFVGRRPVAQLTLVKDIQAKM